MFPAGVLSIRKWTKEDVDMLKILYDARKPVDWKMIGRQMARTAMSCRKAWEFYHKEKRALWTENDDAVLKELKEERRLSFKSMVPFFEDKWTEIEIKNRWRNLCKPARVATMTELQFPTVMAEFHAVPTQNPTAKPRSEKPVENIIESAYDNSSEFCEEPWMWGYSE
jgi:hypothetical protein